MSELAPALRSRGMRDLLPDEMERVRAVEDSFSATCRAWGYREIRTPVIEPLYLFTSAGTLSPQTLDRVYSFLDWDGWSGERVVLRPDSTIPAARLYAERLDGGRVAKLFYNQNVFHFTDDGSSREVWQCGVELIGDTGAAGDVELVELALAALRALGLETTVRLSHAGLVRAVLAAAGMTADEQSAAYDRLLDGDLGVVDEVEARVPQLNAPLRLLFDVEGQGSGYLANVRESLAGAIPALVPALDELAFVVAALEARGVAPVIQSVLARRFEYYSGLVARYDARGVRVGGGGRYDELIGLVGGRRVPASGFALYVTPLIDLIAPAAAGGARCVLVEAAAQTPAALAAAHGAAEALRAAGVRVETIEGADTAAAARLVCGDGRFTLASARGSRTFEALGDVVQALERDR